MLLVPDVSVKPGVIALEDSLILKPEVQSGFSQDLFHSLEDIYVL